MKYIRNFLFAGVAVAFSVNVSQAGDVRISGVHLCCGSCVAGANEALEDIEGVSKPTADRNGKTVTFVAADEKAAKAGLAALAEAGFYGSATHDDKEIAFPDSGAKKGLKVKEVTLTNVHLCCTACVNGAKEVLEKIPGLSSFDIDRNASSVTVRGSDILVTDAVAALNKGGFYAKVKTEDK